MIPEPFILKKNGESNLRVLPGGHSRKLPHSPEAEQYLLACVFIDPADTLGRCAKFKLKPAAFFEAKNRIIFEKADELYRRSLPIDLPIIAEELKTSGDFDQIGGYAYLVEVSQSIPTVAQVNYFIDKLIELWVLREAIKYSTKIVEDCYGYSGGLPEQLSAWQRKFTQMAEFVSRSGGTPEELIAGVQARVDSMVNGTIDRSRWIYTGLDEFDRGLLPFDYSAEDMLCILMGPPSDGKSSLARQLVHHNASAGKRCAVFMLETSCPQYVLLMACMALRINAREIARLPADMHAALTKKIGEIEGLLKRNLFLHEDIFSIEDIEARCRMLAVSGPLDLIVIDYTQLVTTRTRCANREQEIALIASRLKILAKAIKCPVLALAQISREAQREMRKCEHDKDGKLIHRLPTKNDLRESGSLENAADRIIGIYTPPEDCRGAEQTDNQAQVEVWLCQVKSRNGPKGYRKFWFFRPHTYFFCRGASDDAFAASVTLAPRTATGYAAKKPIRSAEHAPYG